MTAGSLAGFALVGLVCTWALSAAGGLALAGGRGWLQRTGPLAERRAAVAVAVVPLVLGATAVVVLVLQSALGVDHCHAHDHHAHLCIVHGARWLETPWVVSALAVAGAIVAVRSTAAAIGLVRGARSIRALHAVSRPAGEVRMIDSERAVCFVAGARPAIYVSDRAWASLSAGERAALVAHEQAHVQQGDLRMRLVLEGLVVFAAPLVAERVRTAWLQASERLCDARAARATGEPADVASAMVALCRLQAGHAGPLGFTPTAGELAGRVRAVLAGGPLGERASAILARTVALACVALAGAAVIAAAPLHHALETLLG